VDVRKYWAEPNKQLEELLSMSMPIPKLTRKVRIATMSVFLGFGLASCADESDQMEEPIQAEGESQLEESMQEEGVSLDGSDDMEVSEEDGEEIDEDLVIETDDETPLEADGEEESDQENKDFLVDDSIEDDSSLSDDEAVAGDQEELATQEEISEDTETVSDMLDQEDQVQNTVETAPVETNTVSSESTGNTGTYVIQSGDTLGKISSRIYGTASRWSELAQANGISDPTKIFPGDELSFELIGQTASRFAKAVENMATKEIVVEQGDTLSSIAKKVIGGHASWKQIYAYNKDKVSDPNKIEVGMRLTYVPSEEMVKLAGVNGSPQNSEPGEEFAAKNSE
jgi:nucleoid-associated protein YgaU